jgi:hypothetical protein
VLTFILFVMFKKILFVFMISLSFSFVLAAKPDNCDDTAYQAHPGYNGNEELWDGYMANSDGVCQSQFGRGVPSPCVFSVQVSVGGNPYYLCWYNNTV